MLGKPYGFGDRLAKAIPDVLEFRLRMLIKKSNLRKQKNQRQVYDMALKLEDIKVGTHAAGVVIAPALTDHTFNLDSDKGTVLQFDMGDVESAGLVNLILRSKDFNHS